MNNPRLIFYPLVFLFCSRASHAQTASLSGVINRYTAVTVIDSCSGKLTVGDTAGFKAGASALLIQMQGADISSANNFLYGIIQAMNYAGRYERVVIDSVAQSTIFVQKRLVYPYNLPGKVQLVSIPQYTNATVADTLRCQPWNGATGGVLALEVAGTLTLNAPVVTDGMGFRGGVAYVGPGNNCNFLVPEVNYYYPLGSWRGAYKGEGIAAPIAGKELGRGPQANGGGGGNDHNSGGGGGGNVTDGGNGGDNDEPGAFGCDGYYPGVRGYGTFFTANRIFLGGGGGAGHVNNAQAGAGARGGGIIFLQADNINGSVSIISANGNSAAATDGDGAGGGGAGGTIWLKADAATPDLIVRADGGKGGNTVNNNANRCFGPGGGGAGGRILSNLFGIATPAGGQAGIVTNSAGGCNGSPNGAGNGDTGIIENLSDIPAGLEDYTLPLIATNPASDTVCPGATAVFSVQTNVGAWDFQWQLNDGSGWQDISGGAQFIGNQTNTLTVLNISAGQNGYRFRCKAARPGCYESISADAPLVIGLGASAGFTPSVNGQTVNFSNQSVATSYFWDFGDGTTSQALNPQHTYAAENTYTVTLYAINACDTAVATQAVVILLPPTASFSAPSPVAGCGALQVPFTNNSSANAAAFSWSFPGGFPSSSNLKNPVVTYTATGVYQVTLVASNNAGQDVFSQLVVVTVNPSPIADFTFFIQPDGTVQFADQSLNATNLLWNFGDNSTSSDPDPAHVYAQEGNYTVTLTVWNGCDTVAIQQTVAASFPPAAGFFVADTLAGCQTALVEFENTSSANATVFNWSFPGGNPTASADENPSASYSSSGTYTATLVVSNPLGSDTIEHNFTVQVYDFPVADFTWTAFPGGIIRFTNQSQEATSFTWDFGDGDPQASGFNIDHQYGASGTYTVTLIATSPCGVSIMQQNIEVVAGGVATGEPQGLGNIRLFPNPVGDRLTVDCSETSAQPIEIQVFDATGKRVASQYFPAASKVEEVAFSNLAAGAYRVAVLFNKGGVARSVIKR